MKKSKLLLFANVALLLLTATSCRRTSNDVWEDTKSAGRHVSRGMRSLGGKHGDSRQINSRDEFGFADGDVYVSQPQQDFVPLAGDPNVTGVDAADMVNRPAREAPGEPGSSIPGIEAFQDPSTNPKLASVFKNIHFDYNSNLVKGDDNIRTVQNVANYMKQSPNTYVFVEGHCDERGPQAYNFALGSHRSNSVRNYLIQEGVSPDNIFTISYGKDKPIVAGHDDESWFQNRRAEFRVYEK